MIRMIAFLVLLPLSTMAGLQPVEGDKILHVRESHPMLEGMEVELENGQVVSLQDFLVEISEDQQNEVKKFGGEVPWPKSGDDEKKDKDN